MRVFWLILGFCFVGLAIIGALLPLMPSVVFLLLAAFCFARSSKRLHDWLLGHPHLGPPIENWNRRGAISLPAKGMASLSMVASLGLSWALDVRPMILGVQAAVLALVAVFIWTRPSA